MGLIYLLLLGLALAWLAVVLYTSRLLTRPPRRSYAYAVSRGKPGDPRECLGPSTRFTSWSLRSPSSGEDLPVWDIVGEKQGGPTMIVSHGWGDSRVVMLARLAALMPHASRIILWDMPGHGDAPAGTRSSLGTREVDDLLALIESAEKDAGGVVLYGFSLGAGVSIAAAARAGERVRAVIAEAPYRLPITPAQNVLELRGLPHRATLAPALALLGMANAEAFDRAAHARGLHAATRLLVIHGEQDAISPIADGREIAVCGRGTLVSIPNGTHADLWTPPASRQQAESAVAAFMNMLSTPGV